MDLLCDEAVRNPHPFFGRMRETAPVHWNERHQAWVLTRYHDVAAGLRDSRLSAERITPFLQKVKPSADDRLARALAVLQEWLVFKDPPDHTRLRRLVSRAFTPAAVRAWTGTIGAVVDDLLDDLEAAGGTLDLVRQFAYPLPAVVIAQMLGVPAGDRDLFKAWSDQLVTMVFGAAGRPDRFAVGAQGVLDLGDYFDNLIAHHQRNADDNLVGLLLQQEEDDALSHDELIATCILLLFAGHETTTNLIGSAVLALLEHPDQLSRLKADPSLLPTAVEEFLRWDGPNRVTMRIVRESYEFAGSSFEPGQRVLLVNLAANRDPEAFSDPDELDVSREPNNHLGFGFGIHYCLGAPLARLEAEIAIGRLLQRFSKLTLTGDHLDWHPTMLSRGLTRLPVILTP